MCSNNFVPRVFALSIFLLIFSSASIAQSHLIGEAWKDSAKPSADKRDTTSANSSSSPQESANKNLTNTDNSVSNAPNIQVMNPPLVLEAEVAVIKSTKLEIKTGEEMVGIEPPATFNATAYSLTGKTRTGARVRRGVIAADPQVLPLGSVVHLKAGNYSGLYTVHDTGSAIRGKHIDVWMPSSREARSFGRQNVRLTVLKYGGNRKPKSKH